MKNWLELSEQRFNEVNQREDAKLKDKTIISRAALPKQGSAPEDHNSKEYEHYVARSNASNYSSFALQATSRANRMSKQATTAKRVVGSKAAHAEAGELHLQAATMHEQLGNHDVARAHKNEAEKHALLAGGEWDEGKHPRDENGKFS